jgi:hypothetical protein
MRNQVIILAISSALALGAGVAAAQSPQGPTGGANGKSMARAPWPECPPSGPQHGGDE